MRSSHSYRSWSVLVGRSYRLVTYNRAKIKITLFTRSIVFFKYRPVPASFSFIFVLFTPQINYKLKKRSWSAWDSNPGPQDGRRRQNHGAMAATCTRSIVCVDWYDLPTTGYANWRLLNLTMIALFIPNYPLKWNN